MTDTKPSQREVYDSFLTMISLTPNQDALINVMERIAQYSGIRLTGRTYSNQAADLRAQVFADDEDAHYMAEALDAAERRWIELEMRVAI